jgi:hypothetical protein
LLASNPAYARPITITELLNLRILRIHTYKVSKFLEKLCATILLVCSSLEEIKIEGVSVKNQVILNSATCSLRCILLNTYPVNFVDIHEHETEIDQSAAEIRWSNLCTLFARNPQISKLELAFNIGLPPLTYEKIRSISKICPQLESMYIHASLSGEDHAAVLKDGNAACRLNWLYSSGSTTAYRDTVIMEVLKYVYDRTA